MGCISPHLYSHVAQFRQTRLAQTQLFESSNLSVTTSTSGGIGRHDRLRTYCPEKDVQVQVLSGVPGSV